MFEKFTDRARKVIGLARQEAERLKHDYIGTEHILLGVVGQGSGAGVDLLKGFGVNPETVRAKVEGLLKRGPKKTALGHMPFTPRAKRVLELAYEEARGLEHDYVGTEHLLLGLIRVRQGVAGRALTDLGLSYDELNGKVAARKDGAATPEAVPPPPLPFTLPTMHAIGLASEQARAMDQGRVGTEHLLLGLLREGGVAARALTELGLDYEGVKNKVADIIGSGSAPDGNER